MILSTAVSCPNCEFRELPMLTITDAEVRYSEVTAFSGFSLKAERGDMISIIGPSGCGKTSLLSAVAGLVPLSRGSISLEGGVPACSIMFQQDCLLPWKRVRENTLLGAPKESARAADELLELFGLTPHAEKYPKQLSGGERQRTALIRALVRRPRLILLDEPLSALDEQTREELQNEIASYLRLHGITLLLVTHSIREAIFMGSRILVMKRAEAPEEFTNPDYGSPFQRTLERFFTLELALREALSRARETYR
jgi:ABC-type nitrate/sulfonate/bicarbonate transport system ATPase subunit